MVDVIIVALFYLFICDIVCDDDECVFRKLIYFLNVKVIYLVRAYDTSSTLKGNLILTFGSGPFLTCDLVSVKYGEI